MKTLSIEARVGLLILVAIIVLAGFILTLNPGLLKDGYIINVDFNHPGALQPGAPVHIGSVRVGRVDGVDYLGGKEDPITKRRPMIRVRARIDREYLDRVYENAQFYVTTASIVGEPILAIDPGDPARELLGEDAYVIGTDSARFDLLIAKGYEIIDALASLMSDNREELDAIVADLSGILRSGNEIIARNDENIDRIIENVVSISDEANDLIANANKIVSGPRVSRIVRNVDETMASVNRDIDPIMKDVKSITAKVDDALDVIGPEQREQVKTMLASGETIVKDAEKMVAHVREGRGTVGAILMDEAMYDDIQELIRDLKHNPWKLFWKE